MSSTSMGSAGGSPLRTPSTVSSASSSWLRTWSGRPVASRAASQKCVRLEARRSGSVASRTIHSAPSSAAVAA